MAGVKQLGYVGFEVRDLGAWKDFGTSVLGFEANPDGDNAALSFRMDSYARRVMVRQGPADDLVTIGWEVESDETLRACRERIEAAGLPVISGTGEEASARCVVDLIKLTDPNGIQTEIFYGPLVRQDVPFRSPRLRGGFVTGGQGLGHLTLAVDSLEDSLRFYRDVLGMRLTDWVQPQLERAVESTMNIAFLHCNSRHHSLAFWEAKMPKRVHHLMVQCESIDDVGSTYELVQERGVPLEMTLGRHTNDNMLSFYMQTPSGFSVEFGWGARTVDDADWQVQLHKTGSSWGHRRVAAH
jgi:2,3-dihydroxybiphenyl 1,2-dioxygenase